MNSNLDRLASIIKARTPQSKTKPTIAELEAILNGPSHIISIRCDGSLAAFDTDALLSFVANELLAVALAARAVSKSNDVTYGIVGIDELDAVVAALDARLAAVLPGGEP